MSQPTKGEIVTITVTNKVFNIQKGDQIVFNKIYFCNGEYQVIGTRVDNGQEIEIPDVFTDLVG